MEVQSKTTKSSAETRLVELIRKNNGWLSFEAFMQFALYDSEVGYYAAWIRDVGPRGDFSTSAHPGSLLGRAIARWARKRKMQLDLGWRWHLIEIGGGNGELAATILRQLGWRERIGMTYHLVEISRPLRERQKKKLRHFPVRWHESATAALDAAGGGALLFSNELVDAYPCRRILHNGAEWLEMGLTLSGSRIIESSLPLAADEVTSLRSSATQRSEQSSPQVIEVHQSYHSELVKTAAQLQRGSWLTIDYGDTFPEVYHRQPTGTLRGYFHHLRVDGPDIYTRIGQQDLTCDVNFTDLQNWGHAAGLKNESLQTQREFINRWLGTITPKTTDEARLLDPVGAGGVFKVLEQSRGLI